MRIDADPSRHPAPGITPRHRAAILFAHGNCGCKFDLAHVSELLAANGFVVVAPTFADSRTSGIKGSPSRDQIVNACRAYVEQYDPGEWQWGIIGHSAGADTALAHPACFSLGRVCLSICYYEMEQHAAALKSGEPLLLVWSEGDGLNIKPPAPASGWCRCDGCRKAVADSQWYHCTVCANYDLCECCYAKRSSQVPVQVVEQSARRNAHSPDHAMKLVAAPLEQAALLAAERAAGRPLVECSAPEDVTEDVIASHRRLSLVYRGEDAPCHLSVLYAPSNDALLKMVGPLLPIARAAGANLFDLDRYARRRDAEEVGARLAPAVLRFVALNYLRSGVR